MTILYILGAGNSGSSVLSDTIGLHDEVFAAGELVALDRWRTSGRNCQCGARLDECTIWNHTLNEFIKSDCYTSISPKRPNVLRFVISRWQNVYSDNIFSVQHTKKSIIAYRKIMETTKAKHIVDASKDPFHFYHLMNAGLDHLLPIYLIRELEGYVQSGRTRGFSIPRLILKWTFYNIITIKLLLYGDLKKHTLFIQTEELLRGPDVYLKKIQELCELQLKTSDELHCSAKIKELHAIAGTKNKKRTEKIDKKNISNKLSKFSDRIIYTLLGGPLVNWVILNLFRKLSLKSEYKVKA